MANVKTVISIPQPLFGQIDEIARKSQIPRSHLFVLAVEDFVRRHENRDLEKAINNAYNDLPDPEETTYQKRMNAKHSELLEGQW